MFTKRGQSSLTAKRADVDSIQKQKLVSVEDNTFELDQ